MKLTEKIAWLMGRVQRSLFLHLNECLLATLTEQGKRLVTILEIAQVERHVPKIVTRYRHLGRKPLDRQALVRAFVAKALYRHPRPATCTATCNRPPTCEEYVDSGLQVLCRRRLTFRGFLLHFPLVVWATWCMIRWWQNTCRMSWLAT